jgi:hypothetical protein
MVLNGVWWFIKLKEKKYNMDNKLRVLRRLGTVDSMINNEITKFTSSYYLKICDYDLEDFLTMIIQWVCERMYYDYFGDIDDESEEWSSIHNIIAKYIESIHYNNIKDFYFDNCANK